MIKATVDTNVLVSATMAPHGNPARIMLAWDEGRFTMVLSASTLAELADVLLRPSLQARLKIPPGDVNALLARLSTEASVMPGTSLTGVVAADPRDDHVVSAAVESRADCIVTGDEHLLALGEYEGIPILTPQQFLQRLAGSEPGTR